MPPGRPPRGKIGTALFKATPLYYIWLWFSGLIIGKNQSKTFGSQMLATSATANTTAKAMAGRERREPVENHRCNSSCSCMP
jgi:hypothetical protein